MRRPLLLVAALGACAALVSACQSGLTDPAPLSSSLDEAYFRCKVQPILTKSCAAYACHGSSVRYFKLFARNRLRLGGTIAKLNAPMTAGERSWNYDSARSMVDLADPDSSYLLLKPLDGKAGGLVLDGTGQVGQGGYYHGGATFFDKGNVFLTRTDPDFIVLNKWAHGEKAEDQACTEPGSDL
ncbi:MAG: hypothetical protein ABJE95_16680 [Byssovorax sp.]